MAPKKIEGVLGPRLEQSERLARAFERYDRRGGLRRGPRGSGSVGQNRDDPIYALTNFNTNDVLSTALGGGEAGDAAGFGGAIFCRLRSTASISGTRTLISRYGTSPTNTGYYSFTTALHAEVRISVTSAANAFVDAIAYKPQLDRLLLIVYQHTGIGNTLRLWIAPDQVVSAAITGYPASPHAAVHYIGRATFGAGSPAIDTDIIAHETWRGVLSDAAVRALYEAVRVAGDLPSALSDATITHRWSARQQLRGKSRINRRLRGITRFSSTSYLTAVAGKGLLGSTAGFVVQAFARFDSVPVGVQCLVCNLAGVGGTDGWILQVNGAALRFICVRGSANTISVSYTITAADLGTPIVITAVHTGTAVRLYVRKSTTGDVANATTPALVPNAAAMNVGAWALAYPFTAGAIFAVAGADGLVPTAQAVATSVEETERTGVFVPVVGSQHVWDFSRDLEASSGVPATLQDRIGSDHLTKLPLATVVTVDGLRGVGTFEQYVYYQTANNAGLPGSATRFWAAVEVVLGATTGTWMLASAPNANATLGWFVQQSGGSIGVGMGAGARVNTRALVTGDVGRRVRIGFTFDGATLSVWFDGVFQGSTAATFPGVATGFPTRLGAWSNHVGAVGSTVFAFEGEQDGASLPTAAEMVTVTTASAAPLAAIAGKTSRRVVLDEDVAAYGGRVPASLRDRIQTTSAHDFTLASAQLETTMFSSATAELPTQLDDLVTGAPVDAEVVAGLPTVSEIDVSIDGRRSLGISGFVSQAARLQTANGQGIRGALTGFHVRVVMVPNLLSGDGYIAACANSSGLTGWSWLKNGANLRLYLGNAPTAIIVSSFVIPSSMLNTPHVFEVVFDGAYAWHVVDGVATAAAGVAAGTFVVAAASLPMTVGTMVGGSWPLPDTLYALAGSNTVPSPADSLAAFQTWQRTGKLPRTNHASEHYYDFTIDLDGLEIVPATLLDRAGTDHLTRVGIETSPDGGVRGLSAAQLYQTQTGGGIAGAASGFWVGCLMRSDEFVNLPRSLLGRTNMGTTGFDIMLSNVSGGSLQARMSYTAGGTPGYVSLSPGDPLARLTVGRIYDVRMVYDGAAGTLTLYLDGTAIGTLFSITGYTPTASPFYVGTGNGATYGATAVTYFGVGGGHAVPTAQEIATAAAASLSQKRFVAISGRTDRHYDFVQDIIDAGGKLPSRSVDRMGSADQMNRVGAPLQISQRVERAWSYEATPILRGVKGLSQAAYYVASVPFDLDVTLPFWLQLSLRIDDNTTALASSTRRIAGEVELSNGNGLHFFTQTRNSSLGIGLSVVSGGVTSLLSVIYTFAVADIGKTILAVATSDGTRLRLYVKRAVEVGNGAINGTPIKAGLPLHFGKDNRTAATGAEGSTLIGLACGQTALSVGEVGAVFDASVAADGDVVLLPGRTSHLWSLTREGGEAPAQITDRVGSMHLGRVGAPAFSPVLSRSFIF